MFEVHYWTFPPVLSEIKGTVNTLDEAIDIAYDLVQEGFEKDKIEIKDIG